MKIPATFAGGPDGVVCEDVEVGAAPRARIWRASSKGRSNQSHVDEYQLAHVFRAAGKIQMLDYDFVKRDTHTTTERPEV